MALALEKSLSLPAESGTGRASCSPPSRELSRSLRGGELSAKPKGRQQDWPSAGFQPRFPATCPAQRQVGLVLWRVQVAPHSLLGPPGDATPVVLSSFSTLPSLWWLVGPSEMPACAWNPKLVSKHEKSNWASRCCCFGAAVPKTNIPGQIRSGPFPVSILGVISRCCAQLCAASLRPPPSLVSGPRGKQPSKATFTSFPMGTNAPKSW